MRRRDNNSIVFLATLGVYLGLVLVGATPVLGHAATTRHFEISDEIEFNDDLEKKPNDPAVELAFTVSTYIEDVELFLSRLGQLSKRGGFDLARDTFEVSQATLLPCVPGNKVGSYTALTFDLANESLRSTLETLSKRLTDGYALGDCLPSAQLRQEATDSRFILKNDGSNLFVEVRAKKRSASEAARFAADLDAAYAGYAARQARPIRQQVLVHTTRSFSGSQVFVVTRLPRAALDSVFATVVQ
jgi:hypothetical protein